MKKVISIAFILALLMVSPVYASTSLYKAINITQLSLDETIVSFFENDKGSIRIMVTTKNLYILTPPATDGGLYALEKIPLPWLSVVDENVMKIYWKSDGSPLALSTNKFIYFFIKT